MAELNVTFTGRATFETDNPLAPGPFESAVSFQLWFSEDRTVVRIADFPAITFPSFHTEVTLIGGGTGSFDSLNGQIILPVSLRFIYTAIIRRHSDVNLQLTSDTATSPDGRFTVTGSPLDRSTGRIMVVGASELIGGTLARNDCSVELEGVLSPVP